MTDLAVERVANASNVLVLPDQRRLAASVGVRLLVRLEELQAEQGVARVALTGGRTGVAVLEQVRQDPNRQQVDWSRVDVYWSDERFLPHDHPERNERQAREALLEHVDIDPDRVHPMPAQDGEFGSDADAAADAYEELLTGSVPAGAPLFDVCLLGVGEEGHVASVFPESPAVAETRRLAVAVRGCPKPPPTRISLTLPAVRRSREVWLMTCGEAKAAAVAAALRGAAPSALPAAGARGLAGTTWFLDSAAAAQLAAP